MSTSGKPKWLKIKLPTGKNYVALKEIVSHNSLHTICQSGKCPNMGECWESGTATFMILGNICTRSCCFCAVPTGKPLPPDEDEIDRITRSVKLMGLNHCVVTSVDRDDLKDGGSFFWAKMIISLLTHCPNTTIEALLPDFNGNLADIQRVINAKPHIAGHNLETVERLTKRIRPSATYKRSLNVLEKMKNGGLKTKSGLMLGMGETETEVMKSMDDLLMVGCSILTLGQYLQPTKENIPVVDFITPEQFDFYKTMGLEKGFEHVESGPLIRSSYHADRAISWGQ